MQVLLKQLDTILKKSLPSLIFIMGDEPLLLQEARDKIFLHANQMGFLERILFFLDSRFRIETLLEAAQNQSLFSDKKIIDIRNQGEKFDASLPEFFQTVIDNPSADCLVVVSTAKLSTAQQKTAWFEHIKKNAVFVPIWPIKPNALAQWIMERAYQSHLTLSLELANIIAYGCENHLLAAHQVIQKLHLLHEQTVITKEHVMAILADQARFSIFDLTDAIAHRQIKKTIRILKRLEQTAEEPILILWNLSRFAREKNQKEALQKAADIDQIIKGANSGDVWQALLELSMMMCGITVGV